MALAVNFREAGLTSLALAKIGNPLKGEPLLTSKELCKFDQEESDILTSCFLNPFKSLDPHQLQGMKSEEGNPLFNYAHSSFSDSDALLDTAKKIANHLYTKSYHPNIKSGDLCISMMEGIIIKGKSVPGICIIKSENKVPFLQISDRNGDLTLTTQHGIYPDKVDKGCLILNYQKEKGYIVYLFDKSGNTQFWNKDFVAAVPIRDEDYLTKKLGELCINFANKGLDSETDQNTRMMVANRALNYLNESDDFEIDNFERALGEPELVDQFTSFKKQYEENAGNNIKDQFTISKKEANKAQKRLKKRMKLDTGADLTFTSKFLDQSENLLEQGWDENKGMNYVKIYFGEEL
ncbi:MAG: nucleoid-associated protein [Verrucomicrobiota bacterium]|nr:nucleoid-associated protein [Verrucomicrobiota bacterium]